MEPGVKIPVKNIEGGVCKQDYATGEDFLGGNVKNTRHKVIVGM